MFNFCIFMDKFFKFKNKSRVHSGKHNSTSPSNNCCFFFGCICLFIRRCYWIYGWKKSEKSFLLTVSNSIQLSFITGLIIGVFYIFFSKDIINLITNLDIMRYHTYEYLFWLVLLPPIASICYQLDGIFIGATETKSMRNSTVVSVALYLLISTIFVDLFGNHGIWMSVVCLMFFRSITLYLQFGNIIRKF